MSPLVLLHANKLRSIDRDRVKTAKHLLLALVEHIKDGHPAKDVAKELKISRQHLCDIQHGRRGITDRLLAKLVKL